MEGSISARTEKAQNSRCEDAFEFPGEKQSRTSEHGDIMARSRLWLCLCIMFKEIEFTEVNQESFLKKYRSYGY